MGETNQSSERAQAAQRIAAFLVENGLCQVFGGTVARHGRYYAVAFSLRRTLDGEVRVYSPRFIQVLMRGPAALVGSGSDVFESETTVIDFLRLAFVEHRHDEAKMVPRRANSR